MNHSKAYWAAGAVGLVVVIALGILGSHCRDDYGLMLRLAIAQFEKAARLLMRLASGSLNDYDSDMICQRFANGFANALVWARDGH